MNKKAFTMVELIAVFVILGVIALVSVPVILNLSNDSTDNLVLKETIQTAVEAYVNLNITDLEVGQTEYINSIKLINNGYLDKEIKNPETGKVFNSDDYFEVIKNEDKTLKINIIKR